MSSEIKFSPSSPDLRKQSGDKSDKFKNLRQVAESYTENGSVLRPRLHERFFACDGDAIFLKIVASPARGENRMCSHPRTGDATDEKIAEKKSREIQ